MVGVGVGDLAIVAEVADTLRRTLRGLARMRERGLAVGLEPFRDVALCL